MTEPRASVPGTEVQASARIIYARAYAMRMGGDVPVVKFASSLAKSGTAQLYSYVLESGR